jgi:putative flavoprotein involved in K+ transport
VQHVTTIIIGAGHSGLAMSWHLSALSIDHLIIERGEIANSWRTERWDSLRLLTPNWQSRLPGFSYGGQDQHGYMTMPEIAGFIDRYARKTAAPVRTATRVTRVRRTEGGYEVVTDRGQWRCRTLVIASGAHNIASVPRLAEGLPADIASLTPLDYRSPGQLPPGGVLVVGASASGVQIARELQMSGRQVTLSTGSHVRVPRIYRGRDILWWMDAMGAMNVRYDEVDDVDRVRRLPSFQLMGSPERTSVDLNCLRGLDVEIVGKLAGLHGHEVQFSGGLANACELADLKLRRLLRSIDAWAEMTGHAASVPSPDEFEPTAAPPTTPLHMDLRKAGIGTVIWATGFRPDYAWLDLPVFDRKGSLIHDGGVVASPGVYVLGLPFMRRRKSSFIDGAGADAAELAAHLSGLLARKAA